MDSTRLKRAEQVYFEVAGLPADQRPGAVARACGSDTELRAEVESLLAHAGAAEEFLEEPALGTDFRLLGTLDASPDAMAGKVVGQFRIDERIASGGMGTVYRGLRADAEFEQQVAIKLVKRGMDSEEIVRRFRAERRTLAALDHPNIARLIDGGMTPDGQPYLVMEFVPGLPIDEYCDQRSLNTHERLELFLKVCDAVRYAHQNLVVHRDLKPGNILVTEERVPKLLDFGIAKVLNQGSPADVTTVEERRLTPEYASPEQVAGQTITTSSDVYSLGVILYELLTGHRPYVFRSRTTAEVERIVCEQDPPAPSTAVLKVQTRLSTGGAPERQITPEAVSQVREGSPDRLRRRLKGDLDNIVMMALRKDPARRYASVEQLALDIRRYLADLPVSARRETPGYLVGKFVKRNAWGVSVGAAAAVVAVAAFFFIRHQRDEAYAARDQAERIADFMQQVLGAVDAGNANALSADVKVTDILESASSRSLAAFQGNPRILAAVQSTIGRAYLGLGKYEKAEHHIRYGMNLREQHLPEGHHDIAESKIDLAHFYYIKDDYGRAEELLRQALATHERLRGEDNQDTARVWNDLGAVLRAQGKVEDAEQAHRRALQIRERLAETDPGAREAVAESYNNLSAVLAARNDLEGAISMMQRALALRRELLPADHPMVAQARGNLAVMMAKKGRAQGDQALLRQGIALMEENNAVEERVLGGTHPQFARSIATLAAMHAAAGDIPKAEQQMRRAVDIRKLKVEPGEVDVWMMQYQLASLLTRQKKYEEAEPLYIEALTNLSETLPAAQEVRALVTQELRILYERTNRPEKAAALKPMGG
ncbi:MAG TPA: serine/threonine-protein kinase [Phycisphaerales bacterium]|nr:serine/threonine-protein kinase [Phycisphaerales bacterium]